MSDETTELLHVGDILFNEPCDERIVVIAANERNVWLRKVQKNDELAMHDGHVWAMLGKKCNVKNMCTQSYAQHVFELDGHVGQAASEMHGTLTAEQVRDAVLENFEETHETRYDHWEPSKFDWQAIADELNAELGSGTCSMEYGGDITPDTAKVMGVYFCSECGSPIYNDCMPYYCEYCGKKVER